MKGRAHWWGTVFSLPYYPYWMGKQYYKDMTAPQFFNKSIFLPINFPLGGARPTNNKQKHPPVEIWASEINGQLIKLKHENMVM